MKKEPPIKIGFDIDEVLAGNFIELFLRYYNERFKANHKKEDILDYDLSKVFGISRKEVTAIFHGFYSSSLFKEIMPAKGSIELIQKLNGEGHELYVVTGRQIFIKEDTIRFLEHYNECFKSIEFTKNDALVDDEKRKLRKVDVCKKLSLSLLVDDQQEHAKDCAREGIEVFLFDKPWNKDCKEENGIKRIYEPYFDEKFLKLF